MENPTQYQRRHMSLDIDGALQCYGKKSMKGLILDDNGRELSNAEVRAYLNKCKAKGWRFLPTCGESECPDFDHIEHGCPGHPITKEEFESSKQ